MGRKNKGKRKLQTVENLLRQLHADFRTLPFSSDDFKDNLDRLDLKAHPVPKLREYKKTIMNVYNKLEKGHPDFLIAATFIARMEQEERSRPVEKQLPFFGMDADDLLKASDQVLKAVMELTGYQQNRSKDFESAIEISLAERLMAEGWSICVVSDETRKLITQSGDVLVEWDAVLTAVKGEVTKMVFCEVKETANAIHMFGNDGDSEEATTSRQQSLAARALRTVEHLSSLPSKSSSPSVSMHFKLQAGALRVLEGATPVFAYCCRSIPTDIKGRLKEVAAKISHAVWSVELGAHSLSVRKFSSP